MKWIGDRRGAALPRNTRLWAVQPESRRRRASPPFSSNSFGSVAVSKAGVSPWGQRGWRSSCGVRLSTTQGTVALIADGSSAVLVARRV